MDHLVQNKRPVLMAMLMSISMLLSGCAVIVNNPGPTAKSSTSADTGFVAVDNLIVKGDQQRRNGKLAAASATLERALRLAPRSPAVYVALARVKLDAGHVSAAKHFAQKALSLFTSQSSWREDRARSEAQWVLKEASRRQ